MCRRHSAVGSAVALTVRLEQSQSQLFGGVCLPSYRTCRRCQIDARLDRSSSASRNAAAWQLVLMRFLVFFAFGLWFACVLVKTSCMSAGLEPRVPFRAAWSCLRLIRFVVLRLSRLAQVAVMALRVETVIDGCCLQSARLTSCWMCPVVGQLVAVQISCASAGYADLRDSAIHSGRGRASPPP